MARFQWTEEKNHILKTQYGNGVSVKKIAEALNCTVIQVYGRAGRLGLRARSDRKQRPFSIVPLAPNSKPKDCRYPFGAPGEEKFHFCGADAQEDSPYCPAHHILCHRIDGEAGDQTPIQDQEKAA